MTSGVTYKFTYAESEDDFLALEDSWSALIAANPDGNPFLTFEWQWSWWKSYAAKNTDTLKILIATNPLTDQIVGIAPLMLTKRDGLKSLRFIGTGRSDYLGLVTAGNDESITTALLAHIFQLNGIWDYCMLSNIYSPTLLHMLESSSHSRALVESRIYEYAPYLPIDAGFDTYIKGKNKVFRKNIRRYALSTMEDGSDYELKPFTIDDINAKETVALFSTIERKSWKYSAGTAHLDDSADISFWVGLLPQFERKGWLSAWLLNHNDESVAFIIGFVYNNKMYTHTSAYVQTDGGAGNIVRNNLIKTAFDLGLKEFDFMCGDEPYKLSWTDKKREVYQVVIAKTTPLALAYFLTIKLRWRLARSQHLRAMRLWLKKLSHRLGTDAKNKD